VFGGFGFASYPWPLVGAESPYAGIESGGLRLEVEPAAAQVFVDRSYVGLVDDFNGRFHHLDLEAGPHHLEIRADGYEPIAVDVVIQPHRTIRYRAALAPLAR
jgi:hypothetical protein